MDEFMYPCPSCASGVHPGSLFHSLRTRSSNNTRSSSSNNDTDGTLGPGDGFPTAEQYFGGFGGRTTVVEAQGPAADIGEPLAEVQSAASTAVWNFRVRLVDNDGNDENISGDDGASPPHLQCIPEGQFQGRWANVRVLRPASVSGQLGRGSFANVFQGTLTTTTTTTTSAQEHDDRGISVAVKIYDRGNARSPLSPLDRWHREVVCVHALTEKYRTSMPSYPCPFPRLVGYGYAQKKEGAKLLPVIVTELGGKKLAASAELLSAVSSNADSITVPPLLNPALARNVTLTLMRSLLLAADAGLAHLDIKDMNVVVSDDQQQVLLVDWNSAASNAAAKMLPSKFDLQASANVILRVLGGVFEVNGKVPDPALLLSIGAGQEDPERTLWLGIVTNLKGARDNGRGREVATLVLAALTGTST